MSDDVKTNAGGTAHEPPPASSAPQAPAAAPSPGPAGSRALRVLMWGLLGLVTLLIAAVVGLWVWAGTANSLAQALALVQRHVPAAQALEVAGVQGSLRGGGRIDSLNWRQEGLDVAVKDFELAWQPLSLLTGTVKIDTLRAERVQVVSRPLPDADPQPSQPLQSLTLPIRIELPELKIGHFAWDEPEAFGFDGLEASYAYNGLNHEVRITRIELLQGEFSLHAKLGARAPMPLLAELKGRLATEMPEGQPPLPLQLEAQASGPLELLQVEAQAQTEQGTAGQEPARARIEARLAPWQAGLPVQQAEVTLAGIDLRAFLPTLPTTLLSGQASITPDAQQRLAVVADIRNDKPAPWDRQGLPLQRIELQGDWFENTAQLQRLAVALGGGEISGSGRVQMPVSATTTTAGTGTGTGTGTVSGAQSVPAPSPSSPLQADATLQLREVNPQALYSTLAAAPLSGSLSARTRTEASAVSAAGPAVDFELDLKGRAPQRSGNLLWLQEAAARGSWAAETLRLERLRIASNQARIEGSASYAVPTESATARVELSVPGVRGRVDGSIAPRSGKGTAQLTAADAAQTLAWVRRLPGLADLLTGQQVRGNATLDAQWQGGWERPTVQATLAVPQFTLTQAGQAEAAVALADVRARLDGRLDQARLDFEGRARAAGQRIDWNTQLQGGQKAAAGQPPHWQLSLEQLRLRLDDPLQAAAGTAGNGAANRWALETTAPVSVDWRQPLLQVGDGRARLIPPARITTGSAQPDLPITWQPVRLRMQAQGGIAELTTSGRIDGLPFAWANALAGGALAANGITGDLALDADWNVQLDQNLQARIAVQRRSGDINLLSEEAVNDTLALSTSQVKTPPGRGSTRITVIEPDGQAGTTRSSTTSTGGGTTTVDDDDTPTPGRRLTAGIQTASLVVTASNTQVQGQLQWATERLGNAQMQVSSPIQRVDGAWQWAPDAPLDGQLKASFTRLGIWSVLAPPGWRIRGQLEADARLAGTRSQPLLDGTLRGSGLSLRSVLDGVELGNGQFVARLQGNRMALEQFSLKGTAGGEVTAQGQADWAGGSPSMRMQAAIRQLSVSNRADRQVTVSGDLVSTLEGQRLDLTGKITVDKALIVLPESSTPTLGEDVRVADPAKAEAERAAREPGTQAIQPRIDVTLDMGRAFGLRGYGIDTQLRGQLRAVSDGGMPRITGDITTYDGEYRAYGQWLDIERGLIRFSGPYDNPSLDILAIRPRLTQRVGVQVTGPALSPSIRLYADPDLADSEKLAWLLLGRSGAAGGAEAAMLQQAAVALLSGGSGGPGIAGRFGLDQLSVGGAKNSDGETEASLTVGKQLARDLYVTYERSLSGALGTLYVFYDLSRRFTLRGESGEDNAIDLIFTLPYD